MHNMFSSSIGQGEFLKFDKKMQTEAFDRKNGEFLIRTKPVSAVPPQRLNQVAAAAAAAAAPNSSSNESRE